MRSAVAIFPQFGKRCSNVSRPIDMGGGAGLEANTSGKPGPLGAAQIS